MLKNYLKIAWRNLISRKVFTAINVVGLAIGLAACLLIGLYVQDELSYDDFHENADRTYRVLREFDIPDLKTTITTTPSALAPTVEENLSTVNRSVRVRKTDPVVEYGTQKFVENSFIVAEEGFFEIFSFPIKQGDATLSKPFTIVITEEMGRKYFSNENPIGKTLLVGSVEMTVTGVIENVPSNSHLQFGFVASLDDPNLNWGQNNFITYLQLNEGQSREAVRSQIADLIQSNTGTDQSYSGNAFIPHLQPITDIHLGQGVTVEIQSEGNVLYVYLFIALAVFIVVLACINFMNLATARSMQRAREVGLRKTLGASRGQLALQFLGESILTALFALVVAVALSQIFLPFLNNLADKSLSLETYYSGTQVLFIIGITLITGIAAGIYPAVMLSGFEPSRAVKGLAVSGGDQLRKGLVVFQFTLSITLLVSTGIVYKQLLFMKTTGLGFSEKNVVLIQRANFLGNNIDTFKRELSSISGIEQVTSGFSMPGTFFINTMWQPDANGAEAQNMDYSFVDFNYAETLKLELAAGRSLSGEFATDSMSVMLNESAVRDFGWTPEEAVGQQLVQGQRRFTVVGVVKNFHYESLHAEIYSLALFGPLRTPRYVAARLVPGDVPSILSSIQETWKEFSELPFEYSFLADDLAAQYRSEDRLAKVFGIFAVLAIVIGCMGLFGLAAYMASRRTKEIGIRKVLGATVTSIIGLLSKDFLKLVALGFVISVPLAWYVMSRWLEDFAYRIDIRPGIFILAGILAMTIAVVTISWQSLKTALMNPVESLKSE